MLQVVDHLTKAGSLLLKAACDVPADDALKLLALSEEIAAVLKRVPNAEILARQLNEGDRESVIPAGWQLFPKAAVTDANHLAEVAVRLQAALNNEHDAQEAYDSAETDEQRDAAEERLQDAREDRGEMWSAVSSAVHEYRKRAARTPPDVSAGTASRQSSALPVKTNAHGFVIFVVRKPGEMPTVGYPAGDLNPALQEWYDANPQAEISVVRVWADQPGCTSVEDGRDILAAAKYSAPSARRMKLR